MMAPDYTHWHGMYEVAKKFYAAYVPQLAALAEKYRADADPEKVKAAQALRTRLDEVLGSDDHKWFIGKMDPAEAAKREQAAEEFRQRYEKRKN
jgi:hypothetical protein